MNHKEFITWNEFMKYFTDYRDAEERNKKSKDLQRAREAMQRERNQAGKEEEEDGKDLRTLMELEKERRLKDMPKLRPADQIDISEK